MSLLLSSTKDVALGLTGIARRSAGVVVHVICSPVTLQSISSLPPPKNYLAPALNWFLVWRCKPINIKDDLWMTDVQAYDDPQTSDSTASTDSSPIDVLVHHISNAVPVVLHVADGGIKNNIGGMLLGLFSPLLGNPAPSRSKNHEPSQPESEPPSCTAGESSSEKEAFLDRLRIEPTTENKQRCDRKVSTSDFSKSLLKVSDLNIQTASGERVFFVDLSHDYADEQLSSQAPEALLDQGLSLVSMAIDFAPSNDFVNWKPEGETRSLLKANEAMTNATAFMVLEQQALVWSGTLGLSSLAGIATSILHSFFREVSSPEAHARYSSCSVMAVEPRSTIDSALVGATSLLFKMRIHHALWESSKSSRLSKISRGRPSLPSVSPCRLSCMAWSMILVTTPSTTLIR